jgi:branched-subunit amino acid ABC-type transport system permease component
VVAGHDRRPQLGLGCGLAGLAAILIAPISTLQPTVMTNLVLAATAAALVAGFQSFPVALAAGVAMGIAQTEIDRYHHAELPGWASTRPGGDGRCRSS